MARYIDADETTRVIEGVLKKYGLDRESVVTDEIHDAIDNIPTAFDLGKVVQELEEQIDSNRGWEDEDFFAGETNGFEVAIKIVKRGGIDAE